MLDKKKKLNVKEKRKVVIMCVGCVAACSTICYTNTKDPQT